MSDGKGSEKRNEDPAVLRQDIAATRQQMSRTVNEIEERLSPARIKEQVTNVKEHVVGQIRDARAQLVSNVHEAKENIKEDVVDTIGDAKAKVRQATVGRVENMVSDARHVMHDARETVTDAGSSVVDTIRANPIPAALAAVGLGWLIMSGLKGGSRSRSYYGGIDDDGYRFAYRPGQQQRTRGPRRLIAKGGRVASRAVQDAKDEIGNVGHRVQETAENLVHDAGEAIQRTGAKGRRVIRRAGYQARRAEQSFESTLRENPLAIGAVAVAIGAAIGLALPHTQKEDELMGGAKEKLLGKAENLASSAIHKVEEKVQDLSGTGSTDGGPRSAPNGKPAHA